MNVEKLDELKVLSILGGQYTLSCHTLLLSDKGGESVQATLVESTLYLTMLEELTGKGIART
jgi:hypothetical protein